MISADNLSLYFGAQNVFNNVSFMVNKRDKIGLGECGTPSKAVNQSDC